MLRPLGKESVPARRATATLVILAVATLAGCVDLDGDHAPYLSVTLPEALIWSDPFPELAVQFHHVPGREPSSLAVDAFAQTLHEVTDKKQIRLSASEVISGFPVDADRVWNSGSLRNFHEEHFGDRIHPVGAGDQAFLHVIYLDGVYQRDGRTIVGLQVGPDLYVFPDRLRNEGSVRPLAADRVERQTLVHELGHALGLVNCGIPMLTPREHEERCHSENDASVMYPWMDNAQLDAVLDMAEEGRWIPYRFDDADLKDLESFRAAGRGR